MGTKKNKVAFVLLHLLVSFALISSLSASKEKEEEDVSIIIMIMIIIVIIIIIHCCHNLNIESTTYAARDLAV